MEMKDFKQLHAEYKQAADHEEKVCRELKGVVGQFLYLFNDSSLAGEVGGMLKKSLEVLQDKYNECEAARLAKDSAFKDWDECYIREAQIATLPEA